MQFRSPEETPVRIATTTGHIAIVGPEFRDLPEHMHADAIVSGCVRDAETKAVKRVSVKSAETAPVTHDGEYRRAIEQMLVRNKLGDFTIDHLPKVSVVSALCGFNATKEDVLRVFREMSAETGTKPPGDKVAKAAATA